MTRILHTVGIGESAVDALIGDLEEGSNPTVGLSARPGQTNVRITAKADSVEEAARLIAAVEAQVMARLGEHIYGADDERLAAVIAGLMQGMGARVALTETLTAGLIAQELLDVGAAQVAAHHVEPCPEAPTEEQALARAQRLLAQSGAEIAVASLASECPADASPTEGPPRRAAIAVAGGGRETTGSFGFGGHPGLFQPWVLHYTLYLLWRALVAGRGAQ
jgi:hypothetical protein